MGLGTAISITLSTFRKPLAETSGLIILSCIFLYGHVCYVCVFYFKPGDVNVKLKFLPFFFYS